MNDEVDNSENESKTEAASSAEAAPSAPQKEQGLSDKERLENLRNLGDIVLDLKAVLGRTQMPVSQFLKLGRGAVITLNKTREDYVDVEINGNMIAQGEIQLVDESIGVAITETNLKTIKDSFKPVSNISKRPS